MPYQKGLDCRSVKVGDVITRMLGGTLPMQLKVVAVDDTLIYGRLMKSGHFGMGPDTPGLEWTFDRMTGAEVDDDLGWNPVAGTGSFIDSWESGGTS